MKKEGPGSMTDRDFAIWLRNMELAISREAQARGINVIVSVNGRGTGSATIRSREHSYQHWAYRDGSEEFSYIGFDEYIENLSPGQIRIGSKPLEREAES